MKKSLICLGDFIKIPFTALSLSRTFFLPLYLSKQARSTFSVSLSYFYYCDHYCLLTLLNGKMIKSKKRREMEQLCVSVITFTETCTKYLMVLAMYIVVQDVLTERIKCHKSNFFILIFTQKLQSWKRIMKEGLKNHSCELYDDNNVVVKCT